MVAAGTGNQIGLPAQRQQKRVRKRRIWKEINMEILTRNGASMRYVKGMERRMKPDKEAITEILSAIARAQLALDKAMRALMELMELMEGEEHEML